MSSTQSVNIYGSFKISSEMTLCKKNVVLVLYSNWRIVAKANVYFSSLKSVLSRSPISSGTETAASVTEFRIYL